jgi:hypothetical protein
VVKPLCGSPFAGWHSSYGYANFGFKSIAASGQNINKYDDRDLYKAIRNHTLVIQQSDYEVALIQSFGLQKAGHAISECEDIWHYIKRDCHVSLALSDGATESSFAQEWSKELVTAFVNRVHCNGNSQDFLAGEFWLLPLQQKWQQWLANQKLSWFAKRKADEGAFATFLSLEIFPDLSWESLSVGDSCLFVVRDYLTTDHKLENSFPLQNSREFNHRPRLIGTHTDVANIQINQINGIAKLGDRFYLATDAIACWILKQLESNQNPWVKLGAISSQDEFSNWVNELRERHEIANDDTTLLCLEIHRDS